MWDSGIGCGNDESFLEKLDRCDLEVGLEGKVCVEGLGMGFCLWPW